MTKKPRIGITMGDPNGIGPEVAVKAFLDKSNRDLIEIVFIGSEDVFNTLYHKLGDGEKLNITDPTNFTTKDLTPKEVSPAAGTAALKCIEKGVEMAIKGQIDALVTAPISKESIHLAGSKFPGHTEMLKELTGSDNAIMLFESGSLRVALMTIHIALSEVPRLITEQRVYNYIKICHEELESKFAVNKPKIAVCGLNPHAGESGAFGSEEIENIIPAIKRANKEGIKADGPFPADTLFYYAMDGRWDLIISMYHDQGLIPFKMLYFDSGVNITLGLPIIRTSPDHGTAFDIAWEGKANPNSMIHAIKAALKLIISKNLI